MKKYGFRKMIYNKATTYADAAAIRSIEESYEEAVAAIRRANADTHARWAANEGWPYSEERERWLRMRVTNS